MTDVGVAVRVYLRETPKSMHPEMLTGVGHVDTIDPVPARCKGGTWDGQRRDDCPRLTRGVVRANPVEICDALNGILVTRELDKHLHPDGVRDDEHRMVPDSAEPAALRAGASASR